MTDTEYKVLDEDIKLIKNQLFLPENKIIELLQKNKGDVVKTILEVENYKYEEDTSQETFTEEDFENVSNEENIKRKLKIFRNILDQKDNISKNNTNDIDIANTKEFTYVEFNYNTKIYNKKKINSTHENLMTILVKNFLDDTKIIFSEEELKNNVIQFINNQMVSNNILCKKLTGDSEAMYKKWSFYYPALMFYPLQLIDCDTYLEKIKDPKQYIYTINILKKYENELATKFMRKSGIIKNKKDFIIGPSVIVSHFFTNDNDNDNET
jgi:hypothetical protein